MTDKQFNDAFTSVGGWFFLKYFETIYNWRRTRSELIDQLYLEGFDTKRTGTQTRVNNAIRLIDNHKGKEALLKIRESTRINNEHPEARSLAEALISKYYP